MSRTALRLAATAAACAGLLAAAALPAAAADHGRHHQHRSAVVLGAVQYDSPGAETRSPRSLNAEWVTVANTGRAAVDLAGWTLSNADRATYRFHHLRLAGHTSVRVHTGSGHNTTRDVYQDRRTYVWDNTADTATLRNARGHVVSTESWGRDQDRDHRDGRDRDRDHDGRDGRGRGHDRGDRWHERGDHRHERGDHRHDRGDRGYGDADRSHVGGRHL